MIGYAIENRLRSSLPCENTYLTIPLAILTYNSNTLYQSYLILEKQLNDVTDPEIYSGINALAQRLFNAWVALGYRGSEHGSNQY